MKVVTLLNEKGAAGLARAITSWPQEARAITSWPQEARAITSWPQEARAGRRVVLLDADPQATCKVASHATLARSHILTP